LLFDYFGVKRPTERQNVDFTGLGVYLDLGDRARVGVAGRRLHRSIGWRWKGPWYKKHPAPGDGSAFLEMCGQSDIGHRHRYAWSAYHMNVSQTIGAKVGGVGFEQIGGDLHHYAARLLGGRDHGVADAVPPGGERAHAVRTGIGIRRVDDHALGGHP
jgi:hypothetical protein